MSEVTRILAAIAQGDSREEDRLMALVYTELRQLAASKLAAEKPGQTLEATALVHEAWVRLAESGGGPNWSGRAHFFGAAAEAMRRILIDRARRKARPKHGGDLRRLELEAAFPATDATPEALLAIDEALERLETSHPRKARLVKLRFYAGFALVEAAEVLGISLATAKREWAYARAELYRDLTHE